MEKETKIVLAVNDQRALYLFTREYDDYKQVEFVVAYWDKPVNVGDYAVNGDAYLYFTAEVVDEDYSGYVVVPAILWPALILFSPLIISIYICYILTKKIKKYHNI